MARLAVIGAARETRTHRHKAAVTDLINLLLCVYRADIINLPFERLQALGHRRPIADDLDLGPPLRHALAVPEAPRGSVQHGIGGPVDLGGWATVLHRYENAPGATPLLGDERAAFAAAEAAGDHALLRLQQQPREQVMMGGDLGGLRERVRERNNTFGQFGAVLPGGPYGNECVLKALHGHAAWAPGQLDGEIRAKAWTWAAGIGPSFAMTVLDTLDADGDVRGVMWEKAMEAVRLAQNGDGTGRPGPWVEPQQQQREATPRTRAQQRRRRLYDAPAVPWGHDDADAFPGAADPADAGPQPGFIGAEW